MGRFRAGLAALIKTILGAMGKEPIGALAAIVAVIGLLLNFHSQGKESPILEIQNIGITLDRSAVAPDSTETWRLSAFLYAWNTGRRTVNLREKGYLVVLKDGKRVVKAEAFLENPDPGEDPSDIAIDGFSERRLVLKVFPIPTTRLFPEFVFSQERVMSLIREPRVTYILVLTDPAGSVLQTKPEPFTISATCLPGADGGPLRVMAGAVLPESGDGASE